MNLEKALSPSVVSQLMGLLSDQPNSVLVAEGSPSFPPLSPRGHKRLGRSKELHQILSLQESGGLKGEGKGEHLQ